MVVGMKYLREQKVIQAHDVFNGYLEKWSEDLLTPKTDKSRGRGDEVYCVLDEVADTKRRRG